jgi:hypothetical protein
MHTNAWTDWRTFADRSPVCKWIAISTKMLERLGTLREGGATYDIWTWVSVNAH